MRLVVGRAYLLQAIGPALWDRGHPVYGTPDTLAGKYLGCLVGVRRWHGFEIHVDGAERGVIFMTDADLAQIQIRAV